MKITLEKALAGAKLAPKTTHGHSDFDALLKFYAEDSGLRDDSVKRIRDATCTCHQLNRSWGSLAWLMGFVYRINLEYDSNALNLLNTTPEERGSILDGMGLLRTKLVNYKVVTNNTTTKMLYDKITVQHF